MFSPEMAKGASNLSRLDDMSGARAMMPRDIVPKAGVTVFRVC